MFPTKNWWGKSNLFGTLLELLFWEYAVIAAIAVLLELSLYLLWLNDCSDNKIKELVEWETATQKKKLQDDPNYIESPTEITKSKGFKRAKIVMLANIRAREQLKLPVPGH